MAISTIGDKEWQYFQIIPYRNRKVISLNTKNYFRNRRSHAVNVYMCTFEYYFTKMGTFLIDIEKMTPVTPFWHTVAHFKTSLKPSTMGNSKVIILPCNSRKKTRSIIEINFTKKVLNKFLQVSSLKKLLKSNHCPFFI